LPTPGTAVCINVGFAPLFRFAHAKRTYDWVNNSDDGGRDSPDTDFRQHANIAEVGLSTHDEGKVELTVTFFYCSPNFMPECTVGACVKESITEGFSCCNSWPCPIKESIPWWNSESYPSPD
jgi:hypothetical protein